MRLFCQKAFLLAVVGSLACKDVSSPPGFPADYILDNINGRALPTFVSPIPEVATIVSAELHLDGAGSVLMIEHERDLTRGDVTVVNTLDYRIVGTSIEIGCLRHEPVLCIAHYTGVIGENGLSLTIVPNEPVVYNYKITPRAVVN